jgi:3'-phosphoadenosine 5'-phosphosulfate (PAPS) 3'-phosphatase
MFTVNAASVDEYLRFDPARERDMRALDALIRAAAPTLSRWFVPGTRSPR